MPNMFSLTFLSLFLILIAPMGVAAKAPRYERSVQSISIPDVMLVNQDGKRVRLPKLLAGEKPVVVDFIYATCTTICPILSVGFSNLQKRLGKSSDQIRLVSITIDPANDTPTVMKEYLRRYRAKPGWEFLSGSRQDIDRVMHAFDAYFRDKMDHQPLNFIRTAETGSWIRLYGLMSGRDFRQELETVGAFK